MSSFNSEWLSSNEERGFPLSGGEVPNGFILDARITPDPNPPVRGATHVRVRRIFYDLADDSWTISIDFPELSLSDSVSFSREVDPGVASHLRWRKGFGDLCSMSVAAGPLWDSPSGAFQPTRIPAVWSGGVGYEYGDLVTRPSSPGNVFMSAQAHTSTGSGDDPPGSGGLWQQFWVIHPWSIGEVGDLDLIPTYPPSFLASRVESGPDRFLGFRLNGETDWEPSFVPENLIAGWNINASSSGSSVSFSAVPGGGEGKVPCEEPECSQDVRRISGVSPSPLGEVTLDFEDCLRSEIASDVSRVGLKISSDCLPCCGCGDYNAVSRAIARQSAKLGDVRDELRKAMETTEASYNEAVENLNAQVNGLVSVHSVRARPSKISFYVQNNTLTDVYAVISLMLPENSGATLVITPQIMSGIQTESPPLTGLDPGGSSTGLSLPSDSEGWIEGEILATVGSGSDFSPIPPKGKTLVTISFEEVREILEDVAFFCSALDLIFSDPKSATVHPLFDSDSTIFTERNRMSSLEGVSVEAPESWTGSDAGYITACSSVPPSPGVDCSAAFAAISGLRSAAEIRVFARRAQILFVGTNLGMAGSPIISFPADPEAADIAAILAIPLDNGGADSVYFDQLEEIVTDLTGQAENWLWGLVNGKLSWQLVDPLTVIATAIYGEASFACKAFSASFVTDPFQNSEEDILCMDGVIALFSES